MSSKSLKPKPTDERETPQSFFEDLNREFNFDVDVCATAENCKVAFFFGKEEDGLQQSWSPLVCWMNPPYSDIYAWVKKAAHEAHKGATVVALLPTDGSTRYFHHFIWDEISHTPWPGVQIRFPPFRLTFKSPEGEAQPTAGAKFASMIVVLRGAE